jgi:hypothetical protein
MISTLLRPITVTRFPSTITAVPPSMPTPASRGWSSTAAISRLNRRRAWKC